MFVMLSYSWFFLEHTPLYFFWSDQCYHRVHLTMEFLLKGNLDELLIEPIDNILIFSMILLDIKLVLGTL